MKSTLVEFYRFADLETGILRKGDRYLLVAGQQRVRDREMPINQRPFNTLMKALRYEKSNDERRRALTEIEEHVSYLLELDGKEKAPLGLDLKSVDLQQLDLVVNAAELAGIPFESAGRPGKGPLFLEGGGIVLTRRVRGAFSGARPEWPTRPRILFVWSAAGGMVPVDEHRDALLDAVGPFLPPRDEDRHKVFVEVPDAGLEDIQAACAQGPFSHLHLLAHGDAVATEEDDRFGVALKGKTATPEELAEAFAPLCESAMVFTLAACDAANEQDSITPEKSLAHALHVAGLPVVIASQLPLTVPGSNILVRSVYRDMFAGKDVRAALHNARVELHQEQASAGHDWASLVGYVRLREGYEDHLKDVRLRSQMAALDNLHRRTEVFAAGTEKEEIDKIRGRLEVKIKQLTELLEGAQGNDPSLDENLGLLGSGEKRLAELLFRYVGDDVASREALVRARSWYRRAFEGNPSHHWSGVQYLVLQAALDGEMDGAGWATAYRAAEVERRKPDEYWAQGSLVELALLAPLVGGKTDRSAEGYLREMCERVDALEKPPDYDPKRSTKQQLLHYVDWWKADQGFFGGRTDFGVEARRLAEMLPE